MQALAELAVIKYTDSIIAVTLIHKAPNWNYTKSKKQNHIFKNNQKTMFYILQSPDVIYMLTIKTNQPKKKTSIQQQTSSSPK